MLEQCLVQRISILAFLACATACALSSAAETKPPDVVIVRDVMVPMRDGVKLATNLYYPAEQGRAVSQKLPAVLMRIPYNKDTFGPDIPMFFAMDEYFDTYPDVPILSVVGWYEVYTRSTVDAHQAMVARKRKNQYLLVGRWTHANTEPHCGDVICSSNFPNFDINRNTGQPHDRGWRTANNTVHHDAEHPSYIELDIFR